MWPWRGRTRAAPGIAVLTDVGRRRDHNEDAGAAIVAEPGGRPPEGCTRITGAVAACTLHAERKYRLGLQFVKVSKKDKGLIAEFVKHHERRKASRPEA